MSTAILPARRVMLLDLGWKQTGYLAAALGECGLETTLLTTGQPDAIGLGHYCRQIATPDWRSSDYVPFLRRQISSQRPDLVMPLCEPLIELLWDLDPPCEVPIFPSTTDGQRAIVRDRRRFYQCAAGWGLTVAPWLALDAAQDLERAISQFGFPLVLRGTGGCGGSQVRIVACADEAVAALEELKKRSPGQPFAQRFVRGRRNLVGGVFRDGEALRIFAQETLESNPPITGPSIRVRAHDDGNVIRSAQALFAGLEWSGIACAEFIRDERGHCILMEMNPRPWAALEVAERCGAGICRSFAELLAGRALSPSKRYRSGGDHLVLEGYLLARRKGGIGSTLRSLSAREWRDGLRALPWGRPWLALHILRRLYRSLAWACSAAARDRLAGTSLATNRRALNDEPNVL